MLSLKLFKLLTKSSISPSLKFAFAAKDKPPADTSTPKASKIEEAPQKPQSKPTDAKAQSAFDKFSREDSTEISKTKELALERLKRMKQKFSVTKDQFRVDVGLIIDRPPIFLHLSDKEMQFLKFRNSLEKKYKMIPPVPPELIEYYIDKSALTGRLPQTADNRQTHGRDLPDGTEEYYCEHSRVYYEVDPTVTDPKSIQRAGNYRVYLLVKNLQSGEWEFPSFSVQEGEKFDDARVKFFRFLSNDMWKIYYYPIEPHVLKKRELLTTEKKDPRNKRLNGVKIFYFAASHIEGVVEINAKLYGEHAWVTKYEMNQYLSRENYKTFIHSLAIY